MTFVNIQRTVDTIEEEVFSLWFAYIHCCSMNMLSMGPYRDYKSGTVRINENGASPRQSMKKDSAED
jgi:hypothetical protein